ncbi:hypothetical protein A8G00_18035 [Sphingobium sp. SA916]|nr:hypothetical protein A8G00_18035 [Sphingobium sp. SA916]
MVSALEAVIRQATLIRHMAHDFICPTADGELSLFSAVDGRKVVFNSIGLGLSPWLRVVRA